MTHSTAAPKGDLVVVETTSHPLAVRDMLAEIMAGITAWGIDSDSLDRIELIMAEALNNVFEHACSYQDGIYFSARARYCPPNLSIEVVDEGQPMPGLTLPKQAQADALAPRTDVERDALPEGGWGWMLIRDLTDDLHYERRSDTNHLHIGLSLS